MMYDNYINSILMNAKKVPQINYIKDIENKDENIKIVSDLKQIKSDEKEIKKIDKAIEREVVSDSIMKNRSNDFETYYPELYRVSLPIIKQEINKYNLNDINEEIINNIVNTVYNNLEDNIKDIDYEIALKELFKIIIIDYIRYNK